MEKNIFASTYYPLAKKAGDKYGIDPVVILAQAAQESSWGSSYGATNRNNFFGILASGSTNEYWSGTRSQSSVSKLWFRVYRTPQDGFYDFARLISSNYPTVLSVSSNGQDSTAYAHAIAYSPYISETNGDNRSVYETNVANNAIYLRAILGPVILREQQDAQKKKC